MMTEKYLSSLVNGYLEGSSHFLIELSVKPGNHIMVFIDGDHGVTIDDCQALSRFLEQKLDRDKEDFDLMVSSAGADKPLRLPRQFVKNIGKELEIVTGAGARLTGTLTEAGETGIVIEEEIRKTKKEISRKRTRLEYGDITKAQVRLSFRKHQEKDRDEGSGF